MYKRISKMAHPDPKFLPQLLDFAVIERCNVFVFFVEVLGEGLILDLKRNARQVSGCHSKTNPTNTHNPCPDISRLVLITQA